MYITLLVSKVSLFSGCHKPNQCINFSLPFQTSIPSHLPLFSFIRHTTIMIVNPQEKSAFCSKISNSVFSIDKESSEILFCWGGIIRISPWGKLQISHLSKSLWLIIISIDTSCLGAPVFAFVFDFFGTWKHDCKPVFISVQEVMLLEFICSTRYKKDKDYCMVTKTSATVNVLSLYIYYFSGLFLNLHTWLSPGK